MKFPNATFEFEGNTYRMPDGYITPNLVKLPDSRILHILSYVEKYPPIPELMELFDKQAVMNVNQIPFVTLIHSTLKRAEETPIDKNNPTVLEAIEAIRSIDIITIGEDRQLEDIQKIGRTDWTLDQMKLVSRLYSKYTTKPVNRT